VVGWVCFFCSSRRRHTRLVSDWSSDVCSSDLDGQRTGLGAAVIEPRRAAGDVAARWLGARGPNPREPARSRGARPGGGGACRARSEERRVGKGWRWRWGGEQEEEEGERGEVGE